MGPEVLKAAISYYQSTTGKSVDQAAIKVWAITFELATYSKYLAKGETGRHSFKRAETNLRNWLPEFPL